MSQTMNPRISKQLEDFVRIPTVLVTKDDEPYEFKNGGSSSRFKCRRYLKDNQTIPLELYNLVIENEVPLVRLMEFSSGVFLNYIDQRGVYL